MARRPTEDEEDALIVAQALVFDAMEAPTKAGRVAAGEAGLGERSSRRWGHFWAVMETRLCMRARHGLAETLWQRGAHDEAIEALRQGVLGVLGLDEEGQPSRPRPALRRQGDAQASAALLRPR